MLPQFPTLEDLKQSDTELGQDLLAFWIAYQAESKGIDPHNVPQDIQEKIVSATVCMDGNNLPELEKAIRRAAQEDYSTAGTMLRNLVIDGATLIHLSDEFVTGKRRQKRHASKPRPKKSPTNRSLTIESMRKWRKKDHKLEDFIGSAKNENVKDLELKESEKDNKRAFKLQWGSLTQKEDEDIKLTSYSTLEKWWQEANKPPI